MFGTLNSEQLEAVRHGDTPLLIIAGAGTGKTTTLAHRVAHLISTGVDPGRVLLLTFTRRAAAEMLSRVDGILRRLGETQDTSADGKVWGGTFHATAARLLRLHGKAIGLDPSFTILDRGDSEDLIAVVRAELGLAKTDRRFPQKSTCTDIYSRCVNSQSKLGRLLRDVFPWCLEHEEDLGRLFAAYVDAKEAHAILDYDDLLLFWRALLADPTSGDAVRGRFDCVLVDEYQDTNVLQADILKLLRPDGGGVTVVGDDAQAIYSFRAATVRNILDFPGEFAGARVVALEQNYRSTQPILEATNGLIAQAKERHTKNLWSRRTDGLAPSLVTCQDENEQTEFVVREVLARREEGTPLHRQAVLFRAAHHSLALELELTRRNIPFHKYGGLKFAETAHVKDLVSFLRLVENPKDVMAASRVLLLLPGVGPKTARQLIARLDAARGNFAAWSDAVSSGVPTGVSSELWSGFTELMSRLAGAPTNELGAQLLAVRNFYGPLLELRYDDASARMRDLEQIEQLAGRFGDRARFLAEITLDPPAWTQDLAGSPYLDEDYLILSTIHSAKGLEWDSVCVLHAADGNIPSDMSCGSPEEIEEELRLLYVALTRARERLCVCFPLRYYKAGRRTTDTHGYAQLTRFLSGAARHAFELRDAGIKESDVEVTLSSQPAAVTTTDIREQIKGMW